MEADFCIEAVEEALAKNGKPEIFNTDQGGAAQGSACSRGNGSGGSQFTSLPFTRLLLKHGTAISMDGRGAWRDNVFVERLLRSVKYEEVYLRAYDSVAEARALIGRYITFYNARRPHSSLDARADGQAYCNHVPFAAAA